MQVYPITRSAKAKPVVIRALHSLTPEQIGVLTETVETWPGTWIVDEHVDYEGYASLMINNPEITTNSGWFISGRSSQIELARLSGDHMRPIGTFDTVQAVVEHLSGALK